MEIARVVLPLPAGTYTGRQQLPARPDVRAIQAAGLRAERLLAGRTLAEQAAVLSAACGQPISAELVATWEHPRGAKPTSDIALLIHLLAPLPARLAVVEGMNASLASGGPLVVVPPPPIAFEDLRPEAAVNIQMARAREAAGRRALRWQAGRRVEAWATGWSGLVNRRIPREMVLAFEDPDDPRCPPSHIGQASYLMAGPEVTRHVSLSLLGLGPLALV